MAQDILHLSNSLYSEGGGRAQVLVNELGPSLNHDDMTDGVYLVRIGFHMLRFDRVAQKRQLFDLLTPELCRTLSELLRVQTYTNLS